MLLHKQTLVAWSYEIFFISATFYNLSIIIILPQNQNYIQI
nr:MAG TPA: hypothetical protein [Caudoviricetes sp.]